MGTKQYVIMVWNNDDIILVSNSSRRHINTLIDNIKNGNYSTEEKINCKLTVNSKYADIFDLKSHKRLIYFENEEEVINAFDLIDDLYYKVSRMETIPLETHKYKNGTIWVYKDVMVAEYDNPNDTIKMLMKMCKLFK